MTTSRRWVTGLALVAPVLVACSRASDKAADSTASAVDSTIAPSSGAPAVTPSPERSTSAGTPSTPARTDSGATPTPRPLPSETVLTGKVVAGGLAAEPVTSLQIEGGKPTTMVGPLEPELRRLGGATVWVAGAPGAAAPNASFTVSRYEIVAIDGAKPMVGSLITRDGAAWLAAERDTVKLVSPPAQLRDKIGAKVWIVGRRNGGELTPQTFGVIRDP